MNQLHLFAGVVRSGSLLGLRIDPAQSLANPFPALIFAYAKSHWDRLRCLAPPTFPSPSQSLVGTRPLHWRPAVQSW